MTIHIRALIDYVMTRLKSMVSRRQPNVIESAPVDKELVTLPDESDTPAPRTYPSFRDIINSNAMRFVRIPEQHIVQAAEMMAQIDDSPDSSFNSILSKIAVFKEADMTPVVLMDPTNYTVYVVAEETFMKKLH